MKLYSDELVELANQAWILNMALAELHQFSTRLDSHIGAHPATSQALVVARGENLVSALQRLGTRLDALLSKWQRRIAQETPQLEAPVLEPVAWGYRLVLPESIRCPLQVRDLGEMTMTEAETLAASDSKAFYTYQACQRGLTGEQVPRGIVTAFSGVDLNTAKMWWSWCIDGTLPASRLQVVTDNLWEVDCCH